MNRKDNSRSRETKKKIKETFLFLLQRKNPERITIQELCKIANINRTTFYSHYLHLTDLISELEAEAAETIAAHVLPRETGISNLISKGTMLRILELLKDNQQLYRLYFTHMTESTLVDQIIQQVLERYSSPVLFSARGKISLEYKFYLEFCKSGIVGIMHRWLITDLQEPAEDIAEVMEGLLKRCLV